LDSKKNIDLPLSEEVAKVSAQKIGEIASELENNKDFTNHILLEGWRSAREDSQAAVKKLVKVIMILGIVVGAQFLVMVGAVMWFWNNVEFVDEVTIEQDWDWHEGDIEQEIQVR